MAPPVHPHSVPCHAQALPKLSERVWNLDRWKRGQPKPATLRAAHRLLGCARNPAPLRRKWRADKARYYQHRKAMRRLESLRPFVYPDGSHWAVPYPIAWCESGGDYYVGPSGAYGLIPPFPQWLPPRRQDEIAHQLYLEQGEGPWAPYEGDCAYR